MARLGGDEFGVMRYRLGSDVPERLARSIVHETSKPISLAALSLLDQLRRVGVRVALDDFGTGYSGLYHLRELQLDTIKIDRSFVSQMLARPEEARIVKAILRLSQALGLRAEGIEKCWSG